MCRRHSTTDLVHSRIHLRYLLSLFKNAPDCVSEHLNFQNFQGGRACTPLVVRAFAAQLGRYAPKLFPPASLSLTLTFFEKENPAQCEAEQGNQLSFLGMFYWLRVQCFFFNETVYRVLSISVRDKKKKYFRVKFK